MFAWCLFAPPSSTDEQTAQGITDGSRRGQIAGVAFDDGVNLRQDLRMYLRTLARRWFACEIGAGGHQRAMKRPAQRLHRRVRADTHGDAWVLAGDPARCGLGFWQYPSLRAGPGVEDRLTARFGEGIQPRPAMQLCDVGGDQDQTFLNRALFQCQKAQNRVFIGRVAA